MSVGHLQVFFRKMSVQILCPFFNWLFVFFNVELHEFFVYLDINFLLDMFANIFSQLVCCLFLLLMVSFIVQKLLS